MTSLGTQIQEARRKSNMTKEQLAKAMNVGLETVAAWESDKETPSRRQIDALGDCLGTVLFDPQSEEAQREADAKTEQVKAAEFRSGGSNFGGHKSTNKKSDTAKLLSVLSIAGAVLLAICVFGLLLPKLNGIEAELDETKKALSAAEETLQTVEALQYYVPGQLKQISYSDGTMENGRNGYAFTTSVDGNRFSAVVFQLFDGNSYLLNFGLTREVGNVTGTYHHELPSGIYRIDVKANSNLADEYVSNSVYLVYGDTYNYSYRVVSLTDQAVIVDSIRFGY